MNWYFASRVRHKESIKRVSEFLTSRGERVMSGWVNEGSFKPYHENLDKVQALANAVVGAIMKSDIFILISDPEGTDMFVELGIALATKATSKGMKIYIIGEYSKRSLMQLHRDIVHSPTLGDVFRVEEIEYEESKIPDFA